jgi:ferrochelatase
VCGWLRLECRGPMTKDPSWTVLLVAHGTIARDEDIPDFLREVRQGHPAPPALIEEMRQRYRAIGGSPLLTHTRAQATALAEALGLPVRVAMRFSAPRVEDALRDLSPDDLVCLLPAAPLSVAVYEAAARRALSALPHPPQLVSVAPWGQEAALTRHWADLIRTNLLLAPPPCQLILTAHSLPQVVIERGDAYQVEFEAMVRDVLGLADTSGVIAYQSQGQSGGSWLGPSLLDRMQEAKAAGKRSVLVAPLGFLTEHVETLFDLDIEARAQAGQLGLEFLRLATPGSAAGLISAMQGAVRRVLQQHEGPGRSG